MTTDFLLGKDINGNVDYSLQPSDKKYSFTLVGSSLTAITLPSSVPSWKVVFSYEPGAKIWVAYGDDDAEVPAGATIEETTSELNPNVRYLNAGTRISFISNDTASEVGFMIYKA